MLLLQTCFKSCFLVFSEDQLMRVVHKFQTCHVIHTAAVVTCCRWLCDTKCVDIEKFSKLLILQFRVQILNGTHFTSPSNIDNDYSG